MNLPAPIRAYSEDGDAVVAPFTGEGVLSDEAGKQRGHVENRAWSGKVRAKRYQSTEWPEAKFDSDRMIVRCRVSGTFPQIPVLLDFAFTLAEQHIAPLEIR